MYSKRTCVGYAIHVCTLHTFQLVAKKGRSRSLGIADYIIPRAMHKVIPKRLLRAGRMWKGASQRIGKPKGVVNASRKLTYTIAQ